MALVLVALATSWLLAPRARPRADVGPQVVAPAKRGDEPRPAVAVREVARDPLESPTPEPQVEDELDAPPEAWVEVAEDELPPDPVEFGPAALSLRLIDARSGAPVASRVELWRVEAPGNAGWTAGDQLQLAADVPLEGARFANLPEGRYRAVCDAARFDQPPPAFELRAPHGEVEVALEMPRAFELRVRFVDRFGEPYASAEWWQEGARPVEPAPHRTRARAPRGVEVWVDSEVLMWSGDPELHGLGGPQADGGWSLGRQRERSRGERLVRVLRLRAPDGALAEVEVPARAEGDLALVAVGLPDDLAASGVRLPDGRASAARVSALGLARAVADWRRAPVLITAELAGFAAHAGEWRPEQGDLPWILLEPLE